MPVVTLREILKNAGRGKYAVGMFDVHHSDMPRRFWKPRKNGKLPSSWHWRKYMPYSRDS